MAGVGSGPDERSPVTPRAASLAGSRRWGRCFCISSATVASTSVVPRVMRVGSGTGSGVAQGQVRVGSGTAPDPPGAAGDDSGDMTTNEPFAPEPTDPIEPTGPAEPSAATGQPSWGTVPSTAPAGSGTDHAGDNSSSSGAEQPVDRRPNPTTLPGARLFDAVRRLGIVRPDQGRWFAGVATGIAHRYHVDPLPVRIGFAVLTLFGGLGVVLYGLGWLFLPHPDGRIHAQQVLTGTVTAGFVGALITTLAVAPHALPVLLVALVVWMIVAQRRTSRYRTC
jgi:phage shock protein PspC (stress-responsive transcriptional regulator)